MTPSPVDVADRHRRACAGFAQVVGRVADGWGRASPCTDWDARGVLEHVIGFHDVLLLRPLGVKPARPKDDPEARWRRTESVIGDVLDELPRHAVRLPGGRELGLVQLLPMLTTDVLVHTWDLTRAIGVPAVVDPELCETSLDALGDTYDLAATGLYGPPRDVATDADPVSRLVARLGRDPAWKPS